MQSPKPKLPTTALQDLTLNSPGGATAADAESSEDEDQVKTRELTLAERQAQAAKDREEKQRKYEERRQELFGTTSGSGNGNSPQQQPNKSGASTPSSLTPPGSRSATPNRGRGKGGRRGGANANSRTHSRGSQHRELYDPSYAAKPESVLLPRRENGVQGSRSAEIQPVRAPRGPDGSGRGGFGFVNPRPARAEAPASEDVASFNATE